MSLVAFFCLIFVYTLTINLRIHTMNSRILLCLFAYGNKCSEMYGMESFMLPYEEHKISA